MIVSAILSWVAAKLHTYMVNKAALDALEQKTAAAALAQKTATTPKEIDDASKQISSNF